MIRQRAHTPVLFDEQKKGRIPSKMSSRSSNIQNTGCNDLNQTKIIVDYNVFTPFGELESNLRYDVDSSLASLNTSIIKSKAKSRINKKEVLKQKDSKIYPSEFSTFSYKPKFVKQITTEDNKNDELKSNISKHSKNHSIYPKSMNTGHSLTYIKSLPSDVKLKLQSPTDLKLKEIRVYDKRPNTIKGLSELSSDLAKDSLKSHRLKFKNDFIYDKENIQPGAISYRTNREPITVLKHI